VVSLLLGRRREPRHWLIKADGDPAGLAARLQAPLAAFSPSARAAPRTKTGPDHLWQRAFSDCTALTKPDPPSEASYRYRLSLPSGHLASASMACWRRYSPGGPWQRRCGPMSLATFLRHYGAPPDQPKQVHLY
jgi:hypothetical protein